MINYVLGFLFSEDMKNVVLIRKNRPEWQAGFLNGVGGKVEAGEDPFNAMIREFKEETGVLFKGWKYGSYMRDQADKFKATVFYGFGDISECRTVEDEEIEIHKVSGINELHMIQNLNWMIPMFLDKTLVKPIDTVFMDLHVAIDEKTN